MGQSNPVVFNLNEYMNENQKVQNETAKTKLQSYSFKEVASMVKEHFHEKYKDDGFSDDEKQKRQEIEHEAMLGDSQAETFLMNEINEFVREEQIVDVSYPVFFESLTHAIFHEIYRFGVFYKWQTFPNSPSAFIQGKEIWFKVDGEPVKQEEEFESDDYVDEIIRNLAASNKGLKLNVDNPQEEVEMKDGTRVTIIINPRSLVKTIVFRRFTVQNFSFEKQASLGTIAREDLQLFKLLSRAQLNTVVAGKVESGKSTLLKTIYGERDPKKVAILIENKPESYLKRDFPERLVHDFYTYGTDINDVMRIALRVDHDYIIVQEVRGFEAEGAIGGTERGAEGLLMTYHITNPEQTPIQLAQHIVDVYPNRVLKNEIRRIAKHLDLGMIMKTYKGNQKRVTAIYEICYSFEDDSAWINYLMWYNEKTGKWEYNANISEQLKSRLYEGDEHIHDGILNHLEKRQEQSSLSRTPIEPIYIK
ncbi:Flp pilus assembly complex ATPase component TadA [Halobacillus locisalis]|uniref:Flp pilus assembly complex ATPase component TadA n=1 Tax=Halobacillus locisalis TaxID=220753 RepID=A0A838CY25_9BACI|nr:ATPase, T2SS/T4P/T4SS family [Halobacillus locisalis]MBA2176828.1 Flp pilus assembly complex ATPase component TadA [Halobacillus locisalis]